MDRYAWFQILFIVAVSWPAQANATFPTSCDNNSDLGDWNNEDCDSVCTNITGAIRCDLQSGGSDPVGKIYAYSHDGDFIIFGKIDSDLFCCDSSDSLTFDRLIVDTDDSGDTVCLSHPDGNCDAGGSLDDAALDFETGNEGWDETTWVRTRDGDDTVYGADYDDDCGHGGTYWCDDIEVGIGDSVGDKVYAGDGGDRIGGYGSEGMYAEGQDGEDAIHGTSGDDRLHGGNDDDVIRGAAGDDIITTGPGNNWAHGGTGYDGIDGHNGNDTLCGDWEDDGEEDDLLAAGEALGGEDICADSESDYLDDCEDLRTLCPSAPW